MNKRQAKKVFKKKYGFNPGQLEKNISLIGDQLKKLVPVMVKTIKAGLNSMHDQLKIVCDEYTKE